jgi:glycosyltransferase involved in cell wall biosynthesis
LVTGSHIIIDCERMKYPHTGLYHFCESLGIAITNIATQENLEIDFFVSSSKRGVFGDHTNYILQKPFHKLMMPAAVKNSIWHATHQQTNYWPSKKAKAIVLTIHDLNFLHDHKSLTTQKKYLKQLQQKVNEADAIVAVSAFTANEVTQHVKLGNKKPIVIYNGVSKQSSDSSQKPARIGEQPFIFSIGTISRKKNLHVLPTLLIGNNMELVIAGVMRDSAYYQEVLQEAKKLGVDSRVLFIGPISEDEKAWCYQHCSVVAFPSIAEGFGLPVLEAFNFGKPVLLSRYGSLPEIGDKHAFYFQDFSNEAMREKLEQALVSGKQEASIAARKDYAAGFSWHNAAKAYIRLYKSLY